MKKQKVFVGIGCGVVQLGLWAYIASQKNCRIVLGRLNQQKVDELRNNDGTYSINIASEDGIENRTVGPIEVYNLSNNHDRGEVIKAIQSADVIVTAVPSTDSYEDGVADLLRQGLKKRQTPVRIYASENRIEAAKYLKELVDPECSLENTYFFDTVIARMGGLQNCSLMLERGVSLKPITPKDSEAILVEEYDSIIIESNKNVKENIFSDFITTDQIGCYEEQKLYGHNAVHFILGSIAKQKNYIYMSDLLKDDSIINFALEALLKETGFWFKKNNMANGTLIKQYDRWAKGLIRRIVNPHLFDVVDRVIKDPQRKLSPNDRLIGTINRSIDAGIVPSMHLLGVIFATKNVLNKATFDKECYAYLKELWSGGQAKQQTDLIIGLLKEIDHSTPGDLDGCIEYCSHGTKS